MWLNENKNQPIDEDVACVSEIKCLVKKTNKTNPPKQRRFITQVSMRDWWNQNGKSVAFLTTICSNTSWMTNVSCLVERHSLWILSWNTAFHSSSKTICSSPSFYLPNTSQNEFVKSAAIVQFAWLLVIRTLTAGAFSIEFIVYIINKYPLL